MEYIGGCHCGRIAYRVEGTIDQVVDCNCSLCRKRGGLLWFVPRDALTLTGEAQGVGTYTFNTHRIQHHFCTTCGIAPYSEGQNPDGSAMACINVRCLEDVDLGALKVVSYDGRTL
jgi:hypothetical protein